MHGNDMQMRLCIVKQFLVVTLNMGRGDAGSTQNNVNGLKQDTHTGWTTTWMLEDL